MALEKTRGFHLQVFGFPCGAKWKTRSWKTSEFDFMDDAEIIEAKNKSDQAEHVLPVHFLPESKKCYDWIQKDVEKDDEERAKNRNQSTRRKI